MKAKRWTEGDLRTAVASSRSIRQVITKLGLVAAGGNYVHVQKYITALELNTSHLKGHVWNRGLKGTSGYGRSLEQVLIDGSSVQSFKLKRRLIAAGIKPAYCEECGWSQRTDNGYLPLEIHHMNGNPRENRIENLQVLCPNCHSLKPHYRARKRKAL